MTLKGDADFKHERFGMKSLTDCMKSEIAIEKDRLLSIIEFSQQSARLRSKPVASIEAHGIFSLFEHDIQGLPGVQLNVSDSDNEDEIWLVVERLHERKPPDITSALLRPWVQMATSISEEPHLLDAVRGENLIEAGSHCSIKKAPEDGKPPIDPEATIVFSDYEYASQIKSQFANFLTTKWRPWSEEEKRIRKTIRLYSQLFTLKQQLEGSIVETQIELVWGVGVCVWHSNGTNVKYPLVGRLVEMSLNSETAALEIRPRDVDARIEIDWFASVDNPGVAGLEKAAKEFFGKSTTTFSPFDRGTFEPLLRTAVTHLDANGIYWPSFVPEEDRKLPKTDDNLKVTDTWALFARPRTNSLFLLDLERLKKKVEEVTNYPPAVAAIVTEPATSNPVVELPSFRGVSASYQSEQNTSGKKARDLFFPKPFNDEQVRIIQLLDISDGVVVQGPPGTGKTHSIANVICHHLAEGKRVLVTSMKDPALLVLQEQLPKEIQPLAISLLTSEQEGMKQFENAIQKIASEVQGFDRTATTRAINHLEETINALHGKLALIDRRIGEWAKRNLVKIKLESDEIDPQDAAHEVVQGVGQFEWIPDSLGISPEFAPRFSDEDIVRLRDARRLLGPDIDYLDTSLPKTADFPASKPLLSVHQDLSQFEKLKARVEKGEVPELADSNQKTLALAQKLLKHIEGLKRLRAEIEHSNYTWISAMRNRLRRGGEDSLLQMLETLGAEIEKASKLREAFIKKPVITPEGMELDQELIDAVQNLTEGKRPFGLIGLLSKSEKKRQLEAARVLGVYPADPATWKHLADYLALLTNFRELGLRWNTLADELGFKAVPVDKPISILAAYKDYDIYLKIKRVLKAEAQLTAAASMVFPNWVHAREVAETTQLLDELEKALRHHLTKSRLANVWATKERFQRILEGRNGRIIDEFRFFLSKKLGNPEIEDAHMQADWSSLMAELIRVQSLGLHLKTVTEVCDKVHTSGAPQLAKLLKKPLDGKFDSLLPDNWRKAWRLRRLATHLESIDVQQEIKKLSKHREELSTDLSRAYRDIVVKRTWLKLAENASHSIRAALQAYLNAIQKIGKGTGKRAVRHRQDARMAASQANPAVPCWIMPHYRVSESLPADLGCFDLVIIDEASQSDLTALPSLLRATKALIVGDDKQVSPEGVGLEEEKIRNLMNRFLGNQVVTYRAQMSPDRSIYDLFKVVFAKSAVMLKEHFRCVVPIIEYSKREFYNHELRPLRVPKASERLDPPLIDVLVEDGYRTGDVNLPEMRFIVDEIKGIVADHNMARRSIGVVSLLADKQARKIWERLTDELGPEIMQRHRITCGDARTFQGKERDIMFLSMVSAPNEVGAPLSRDTFAQRFNVAASRARDRMYLVRSVGLENLSEADRLRRSLITHFEAPFSQDEERVEDLRRLCESPFERELYDELTQRGFWVTPQVRVGHYRIDLVIEGHNDARLAVECDGDKYHGIDKWTDDMQRQRILERAANLKFWRCFASTFIRRRKEMIEDLLKTLAERGIDPIGAEGAPRSIHVERRIVSSTTNSLNLNKLKPTAPMDETNAINIEIMKPSKEVNEEYRTQEESIIYPSTNNSRSESIEAQPAAPTMHRYEGLVFCEYTEYSGPTWSDPRGVSKNAVSEGIVRIVEVEGPVFAKRVYDVYLRGCGIRRMGHDLKKIMNKALSHAIKQGRLMSENEASERDLLLSVVRKAGSPPIKLRSRGPRSLEEIPPSELQVVAVYMASRRGLSHGSDQHLRAVLEFFDLKRLTSQVSTSLLKVLQKKFTYVDEFISLVQK